MARRASPYNFGNYLGDNYGIPRPPVGRNLAGILDHPVIKALLGAQGASTQTGYGAGQAGPGPQNTGPLPPTQIPGSPGHVVMNWNGTRVAPPVPGMPGHFITGDPEATLRGSGGSGFNFSPQDIWKIRAGYMAGPGGGNWQQPGAQGLLPNPNNGWTGGT